MSLNSLSAAPARHSVRCIPLLLFNEAGKQRAKHARAAESVRHYNVVHPGSTPGLTIGMCRSRIVSLEHHAE